MAEQVKYLDILLYTSLKSDIGVETQVNFFYFATTNIRRAFSLCSCGQGCQIKISMKKQIVLKRCYKKAKPIISRLEKRPNVMVLLFLCHVETSKLQKHHYKFSSKFGVSLAWLCIGPDTDASLTFHGL